MIPDRPSILGFLLISALTASSATALAGKAGGTPPNPYIDKGACPFECCTYRDWKTTKNVSLLDKPNGKVVVGKFAAGSVVHALTGEVISTPQRVAAERAYPDSPIKKGDVFYVLHYEGEGFSLVWFKGKTFDVELDQSGVTVEGPPGAEAAWWVNIRTRSGKSGWVLNANQFENQDACG